MIDDFTFWVVTIGLATLGIGLIVHSTPGLFA